MCTIAELTEHPKAQDTGSGGPFPAPHGLCTGDLLTGSRVPWGGTWGEGFRAEGTTDRTHPFHRWALRPQTGGQGPGPSSPSLVWPRGLDSGSQHPQEDLSRGMCLETYTLPIQPERGFGGKVESTGKAIRKQETNQSEQPLTTTVRGERLTKPRPLSPPRTQGRPCEPHSAKEEADGGRSASENSQYRIS